MFIAHRLKINLFLNSVYKNGDVLSPPAKILLYRTTLTSFEACLDSVTEKVKLTNGAVLRFDATTKLYFFMHFFLPTI